MTVVSEITDRKATGRWKMADSMRSISSFGVAGLLSQISDVFYTNDLRARNIGRVSDLVSAKLRESDVDELRIRAILVYGIFHAYALRGLKNHHQEDIPSVSVEIGIDAVHVVVAVSFHWDAEFVPNWLGLGERIDSGTGSDPFEKILESVARHSTQVLLRYEEKDRRIEVVSILNRVEDELRDPTTVVAVDSKTAPLLEVSSYVELGDLNFSKLLRNPVNAEGALVNVAAPQTGEERENVRVVAGAPPVSAAVETRFSATKPEVDPKALQEIREEYQSTISELKNTVHELKQRLVEAENAASERRFSNDSAGGDEEPIVVREPENTEESNDDDWGIHFLKKVWPFDPKGDEEKSDEDSGTDVEASDEVVDPLLGSGEEDESHIPTDAERAAEVALRELQALAKSKKSEKLEATLNEIEAQVEPDKAKRWVDSLSSELLQEKAKLTELQRTLSKQMRQRELEFKSSEMALKHEIKRKEEVIHQRQASIENKNDQIAQLNLAVERASSASNDKESQQIKSKLERTQRVAQMKEEETKSLVAKVRDLENRLIIAQAKAQKGNDLQMATKVQTMEKKVDEYKRINQRLMDSLNTQKEKSNDKEVGDLRRKIDQLDRMNAEAKRSLEKNAFKLRELQDSERKLQLDLARAVEENRSLRKSGGTRGSGESGGQAA